MKGVVIDFSIQANSGLISGDDGNRYTFVGAEWRENSPPVRGMRVDFDTESDGIASAVYQEIIVKPQKTERPTFQKNIQNQTPKAKILYQDDVDESDYTFIDWYKKVVFENYINFEGRARRSEYWWFILVNFGILLIVAFLDSIIMAMDAPFIIFTGDTHDPKSNPNRHHQNRHESQKHGAG